MSTKVMIQLIADYFKTQPVLKAWIFGSFSRGEQTPDSDIDILVVLDESQHVGMKFFGMYEDLKALLGRNVDLVTDRSLAPFARESVDRDKDSTSVFQIDDVVVWGVVSTDIPVLRKQILEYLEEYK